MTIKALTYTEAKTVLKSHAEVLFKWAHQSAGDHASKELKEALLVTIGRMYEVVEGMPTEVTQPAKLN